ncbi:sulfate ABC transporter substrate-binding protein [Methyloversatilis universalis]|uniref:sulfate ABC transporter substrate-binding protein n=1 Tax=Methyloversatilis universalis TaxID=378211 RepID=UPI0003766243|nr:sulfate ABC transporter substrate-binding protein [Methyloversatilis universalis]
MSIRRRTLISAALLSLLTAALPAHADTTLLNVSYDVARELYKDINPAFIAQWKGKTGETLTLNQSHGGSSKQAGAVIGGLEADVITMNQSPDIDILVKNNLVSPDWRKRLPNDAAPYTTTTVFLVRKGNPKAIKDWSDLVRPGLQVIVPNPKTSGNGRYTYVAAWGYALSKHNDDAAAAKDFVSKLFANVPVLDGGGRGATTTFTQRGIGDVLITFENEAVLLDKEVGGDQFDIVYPSLSVEAAAPVSLVDKVVDKRGTRKQAEAYLQYLFSPEGQDIIAKHHFRPRNEAVLKKYAAQFPAIRTFTVEGRLGGWDAVQKAHFADGALYDQIVTRR